MKGKCYYCKKEFTKTGIVKHLKSCETVRSLTASDDRSKAVEDNFILSISPKYVSSDYWLFILINKNSTLMELDQFLRDVWLECCGHLSCFKIAGETYDSQEDSWGFRSPSANMNVKIKNVVGLNDKFSYMYDFGSTTYLDIKVVGELFSGKRKKKIEIMARNNAPLLNCSLCGEKAEYIDRENKEYLCPECLEDQWDMIVEIGDENSPRTGVCGYEGSTEVKFHE